MLSTRYAARIVAGMICLVLGAVGIVVPFFPGVVFLVIAAACFGTSLPYVLKRQEKDSS
ncbi:DUF454 family protein [Microcoleus sp. FACHB-1515]|uniref:DUF454 family protein n=1 Tax=Cyanophyceae TaxID=3028117 RepID=UPI0016869F21|nr:DUF454 family protein [Microcoleus sp. FACHB-1515]MBD2091103.1 DUF454 family protein [Microcoleus sp. FACHB-1515]